MKPGPLVSLSCSPCTGPHILGSPEGAAGLCLPSSAWLNLNRAGLLHESLPAGDKDGQARPGPGGTHCPKPGCLPPGRDTAPAEHRAQSGAAACLSSLPPAFLSACPLLRGQQVVVGPGSYHVEARGTAWSWKPLCWGSPLAPGLTHSLSARRFTSPQPME